MNKKILITGGAGFIGSNLAEQLILRKENIVILDNRSDLKNISCIKDSVILFNEDIREISVLEEIFSENDIEGIIHLAAVSRVVEAQSNPQLCRSVNEGGIRNILSILKKLDKKPWLIFGSSREVYGEQNQFPVKEHYSLNPVNVYGRSKVYGEKLLEKLSNTEKIKVAILRFSNVYGNERDLSDRVLPCFITKALKNEQLEIQGRDLSFDFTYIDDTIDGILKTVNFLRDIKTEKYFNSFNLLFGDSTTLEEVVDIISEYLPDSMLDTIHTDPRNYDVMKFLGCPEKAEHILGFKAQIPVQAGIGKLIEILKTAVDIKTV